MSEPTTAELAVELREYQARATDLHEARMRAHAEMRAASTWLELLVNSSRRADADVENAHHRLKLAVEREAWRVAMAAGCGIEDILDGKP